MSDRVRFRLAVWRYRIRYDWHWRNVKYGFTHPGEVFRSYFR